MTKKKVRLLVLISSVSILIFFVFNHFFSNFNEIYDLTTKTENGYIMLSWQSGILSKDSEIVLEVSNKGSVVDSFKINKNEKTFKYENGVHGCYYTFKLLVNSNNNDVLNSQSASSMFLVYEDMPSLPLIIINTGNDDYPKYDEALTPGGMLGSTIINNNYVESSIQIYQNDNITLNKKCFIKIRGNTSAKYTEKKPYTIKFEESTYLFEDISKEKEFYLIAYAGETLNYPVCTYISKMLGVEWEPQYKYINLIINGDYKGCYILTESISVAEEKLSITNDGFLIENDGYFWNKGTHYFRTNYVFDKFAYTYSRKYNTKIETYKSYISNCEKLLYKNDKEYLKYIDIKSAAEWLLIQDAIGSSDGSGSNMYLYSKDITDINNCKIIFGPCWDFDRAFLCENCWSTINSEHWCYGLLELARQNDEFAYYYNKAFDYYTNNIQEIFKYIEDIKIKYGNDINDSWVLNSTRYNSEFVSISENASNIYNYLTQQCDWISKNRNIVEDDSSFTINTFNNKIYIKLLDNNYSSVNFFCWTLSGDQDDLALYEGHKINDFWYCEIPANRHIKENEGDFVLIHAYDINDNEYNFINGISKIIYNYQ